MTNIFKPTNAVVCAAAVLAGCVAPTPPPYQQPAYYQSAPGTYPAYPAYPGTVQGGVVYPDVVSPVVPVSPGYVAPGYPGYYYGPGVSVDIYGRGDGRYRPPPPRPGDRPEFNRPGAGQLPRPNQRPPDARPPSRPGEQRPPGANTNRPAPGANAQPPQKNPQQQRPIFRAERDGGG